jgi:hypothetical protein
MQGYPYEREPRSFLYAGGRVYHVSGLATEGSPRVMLDMVVKDKESRNTGG